MSHYSLDTYVGARAGQNETPGNFFDLFFLKTGVLLVTKFQYIVYVLLDYWLVNYACWGLDFSLLYSVSDLLKDEFLHFVVPEVREGLPLSFYCFFSDEFIVSFLLCRELKSKWTPFGRTIFEKSILSLFHLRINQQFLLQKSVETY